VTALLRDLNAHLPADWRQAEPRTLGTGRTLWFEEPNTCVYLRIGEARLYVRWRHSDSAQYGTDGLYMTCPRKDLHALLPSIVADVALDEAKSARPVPDVPEWARQELNIQGIERYAQYKRKAATARALATSLDAECAIYAAALTLT